MTFFNGSLDDLADAVLTARRGTIEILCAGASYGNQSLNRDNGLFLQPMLRVEYHDWPVSSSSACFSLP